MPNFITFIISLFITVIVKSQTLCKENIVYEYDKENKIEIYFKHIGDTIKEINRDGDSMYIILNDCLGESYFELHRKKQIVCKGNFINGLDTLKRQIHTIDPFTLKENILVEIYFEPLKNGKWLYWDVNGIKVKEEYYKEGILIR